MFSFSNLPPSGCIKTVEEICIEGVPQTARIIGRLTNRDACLKKGLLASKDRKYSITINTQLIEPFRAKINCLYQVIGEVDFSQDQPGMTMTARIAVCVEGTDLIAYSKALQSQREYLCSR